MIIINFELNLTFFFSFFIVTEEPHKILTMLHSVEQSEIYLYLSPKTPITNKDYVSYTYFIYLPSIIINILIITLICKNQLIRIKRNLFLLNLCLDYISHDIITFVHVLFLYENIVYKEEMGLFVYYPIIISLNTIRCVFYLLFNINIIYERLNERIMKLIFLIIWSITLIYAIILIILTYNNNNNMTLMILPQYVQYSLINLLIIIYVMQLYNIINKMISNQLMLDLKIRFYITSVYVWFTLLRTILSLFEEDKMNLLKYYLLDSLEVVIIFMLILNLDSILYRVLTNIAVCSKRSSRANHVVQSSDYYNEDDSNCLQTIVTPLHDND